MSRLSRTASRVALGAVIAAGLAVAAATPISAHTGNLFTVTPENDSETTFFAALNPADAALTPLASGPGDESAQGVEISDEVAYAITSPDGGTPQLLVWDHNTGAVLSATDISLDAPGVAVTRMYGLDTAPSGMLLAFAEVEVENGEFPYDTVWIVQIDPATGVATPVVDLIDLVQLAEQAEDEIYFDSLATDPTTGMTYMFFDYDEDVVYAATVDLDNAQYDAPFTLPQIAEDLGLGYMEGADFDTAGTLWFLYSANESPDGLASTTGAFGPEVGAVSSGLTNASRNLAYDPYVAPAPQLAATGSEVSAIAVVGSAFALAALGGALLFVSSRRRSA